MTVPSVFHPCLWGHVVIKLIKIDAFSSLVTVKLGDSSSCLVFHVCPRCWFCPPNESVQVRMILCLSPSFYCLRVILIPAQTNTRSPLSSLFTPLFLELAPRWRERDLEYLDIFCNLFNFRNVSGESTFCNAFGCWTNTILHWSVLIKWISIWPEGWHTLGPGCGWLSILTPCLDPDEVISDVRCEDREGAETRQRRTRGEHLGSELGIWANTWENGHIPSVR